MAFNPAPNAWIASWSEDGTTVSFPIASLPQLTAAEADGATGDLRDCLMRLIDHTYDYVDGLAAADKPTKLSISRSINGNPDGTVTYRYQMAITNSIDSNSVVAE